MRADDNRPTLQSVVRLDPTNQAYLAALSTAEFQRLVTVLGKAAPEWFWDLRSHGGLQYTGPSCSVSSLIRAGRSPSPRIVRAVCTGAVDCVSVVMPDSPSAGWRWS